jgi:hypothetical protein
MSVNEKIKELYLLSHIESRRASQTGEDEDGYFGKMFDLETFFNLIKQEIYDEIKEELIPDELVDIEPDSFSRQYLKGCNGGITDALYIVKNFGVDIDEL